MENRSSTPDRIGRWLLGPPKFLAALIANLFQPLMILLLLMSAVVLTGWKLVSLRRIATPERSGTLERSPAPGRQR